MDGAEVRLLTDTTISSDSNAWEIMCTDSVRYWAMEIFLNPSWGFHTSLPSTITLRVNSDTSTSNTWVNPIFSFSVNEAQYWSTMLSTFQSQTIGPQCDTNTPPGPTSFLYTGDIKSLVDSSNDLREITSGANGQAWQPVNYGNEFPLQFKIENIPSNNQMYVYHTQPTYTQQCGFAEAFETGQGLQIYLHLSSEGESLSVQSFEVEYFHEDETTPNPTTAHPTTARPSTSNPTTANPTTMNPTITAPTTANPSYNTMLTGTTTTTATTKQSNTADPTTTPTTTVSPVTLVSTTETTTETSTASETSISTETTTDQDIDDDDDKDEEEPAVSSDLSAIMTDLGAVGTGIVVALFALILCLCVAIVCVLCRIMNRSAAYKKAGVQAASPKSTSQMTPIKANGVYGRQQLMAMSEDDEKQIEHVTAGGPDEDSGEEAKTDDDDLLQGMGTNGAALPDGEHRQTTGNQQQQHDRVELAIAGGDNEEDTDDDEDVLHGMNNTATMGEDANQMQF
eukprot:CAMPEP_0202709936 /NCGR_PEP_ID=MMETSP1385-20130828/21983_1 /ASSEMBLY_ACC=CAM_ASM_000861 /TAXON_ID=933848 /ORGANISM="Elphidium margaritaceum" /LENGTH=509 /DNA_ID=CAMNT_0049369325 /DNA_START=154 /DNA_END=1683 /DNA_ORIENTATION=+